MEMNALLLREIINDALSLSALKQYDIQGNSHAIRISGINTTRNGLLLLQDNDILKDNVEALLSNSIFSQTNDEVVISKNDGISILGSLSLFKLRLESILALLNRTIKPQPPESINIKLPPNVKDFNDLANVSNLLHTAITQVIYLPEISGEEKILSVENGSIWFNVFVGAGAVTVITGLVWSAAVVYKKVLEARLMEEQLRSLKIKNSTSEDIQKALKEELDMVIQAEANFVASENFKENEPENIERIKNSIKIFSELIQKGAEIHPAIVAPEEVKNLFPNYKNILGLESKIKKLPQGDTAA